VRDGEQIYIDSKIAGGSRVASTKRGPINVNRATAKDLEALPGIGPVLASRILEYRKLHGSFVTVDELQKVPGIGGSKFSQLKSKITI
jgi:competence protein ComEA